MHSDEKTDFTAEFKQVFIHTKQTNSDAFHVM